MVLSGIRKDMLNGNPSFPDLGAARMVCGLPGIPPVNETTLPPARLGSLFEPEHLARMALFQAKDWDFPRWGIIRYSDLGTVR